MHARKARLFSVSLSVFILKPLAALLQTITLTARLARIGGGGSPQGEGSEGRV